MRKLEFLDNLIHVNRYSGSLLVKSESVADHIWCMNALAYEFVPKLNIELNKEFGNGEDVRIIDLKEVIFKISLHDLDESLYCDIPRPFKYHNDYILNAINTTVHNMLCKNFNVELVHQIETAKDSDSIEGILVKIFDVAQAGFKMQSEIMLGNKYFKLELQNVIDSLAGVIDIIPKESFHEIEVKVLVDLCKQFIEYFVPSTK